jgi:hypothetical protein
MMRAREVSSEVRAGQIVCSLLAVVAVSCRPDQDATVSGTSGVALPGRVVWATALHPEGCSETECQATYRVRITNPTDADLFVSSCEVVKPPTSAVTTLPITGLAGLPIHEDGTRLLTVSFQLGATPQAIHALAGATLRCSGENERDDLSAAGRTEP